jgi:DNA polymerase-3 subunit chi
MQPRVDFYITDDARPDAAAYLLCRVVEKGCRQGRRFHLLVDSPLQARFLDRLLWTFRPGSFVPHSLLSEAREPLPPVLIAVPPLAEPKGDILVNLGEAPAPYPDGFERIIEVADANQPGRDRARQRYKWYKEQGYEPNTHRV